MLFLIGGLDVLKKQFHLSTLVFLYGTMYLSCVATCDMLVEWVESFDFKWVDSDLALNMSQFILESDSNYGGPSPM